MVWPPGGGGGRMECQTFTSAVSGPILFSLPTSSGAISESVNRNARPDERCSPRASPGFDPKATPILHCAGATRAPVVGCLTQPPPPRPQWGWDNSGSLGLPKVWVGPPPPSLSKFLELVHTNVGRHQLYAPEWDGRRGGSKCLSPCVQPRGPFNTTAPPLPFCLPTISHLSRYPPPPVPLYPPLRPPCSPPAVCLGDGQPLLYCQGRIPGLDPMALEKRVPLGQTGMAIAPLGIGTWAWGNKLLWGYDPEADAELQGAFDEAVGSGLNFFDTGDSYGTGELEVRCPVPPPHALLARTCHTHRRRRSSPRRRRQPHQQLSISRGGGGLLTPPPPSLKSLGKFFCGSSANQNFFLAPSAHVTLGQKNVRTSIFVVSRVSLCCSFFLVLVLPSSLGSQRDDGSAKFP